MPEVSEDIQYLIQIVKKDLEIHERRKFLEDSPLRIRMIDKKIAIMDEELQESRDQLEKLSKERRHLEGEVESNSAKLITKKIEQITVKNNKEFKAFKAEIEYLTKQIDKEEERILVIMELTEKLKKEIEAISERVEKEKGALLAAREHLEKGMEESVGSLKILEDEKIRTLPHISDTIRRLYNRILEAKGDSGVANLAEDICQGCYSRLPPQKGHEIRKNDQILTCEVCGRILVYYPVD